MLNFLQETTALTSLACLHDFAFRFTLITRLFLMDSQKEVVSEDKEGERGS